MIIKEVKAEKVKTSTGLDTIQVVVDSDLGKGMGSAPLGTSKGKYEVMDFPSKGVNYSVEFVNNINLEGIEIKKFEDLKKIEKLLKDFDGSDNWSKIGGNTVIALEFAILNSFKNIWKSVNNNAKNMPIPLGNCIGGGAHLNGAGTDFQEFLILSPKAGNFYEANFANIKVYEMIGRELKKRGFSDRRTSEGAWAPNLSNIEVLDLLSKVSEKVGNELGFEVRLGLDVAASEFFDGKKYIYRNLSKDRKKVLMDENDQIEFINRLVKEYSLYYVEDPLHEEDFSGFKEIKNCLIAGDDLICTNIDRLKDSLGFINCLVVKPNQVGSLIKTKEIIDFASDKKIKVVMSHRSGDTLDITIADLAVAWNVPFVKFGIRNRERVVKLNELLKIEKELTKDI